MLGCPRKANAEELRRAYLARSRLVHPDKLKTQYATEAFQRLSFAYGVLSDTESKRDYDLTGKTDGVGQNANDTLNGVLASVLTDFLAGDFGFLRTLISKANSRGDCKPQFQGRYFV